MCPFSLLGRVCFCMTSFSNQRCLRQAKRPCITSSATGRFLTYKEAKEAFISAVKDALKVLIDLSLRSSYYSYLFIISNRSYLLKLWITKALFSQMMSAAKILIFIKSYKLVSYVLYIYILFIYIHIYLMPYPQYPTRSTFDALSIQLAHSNSAGDVGYRDSRLKRFNMKI